MSCPRTLILVVAACLTGCMAADRAPSDAPAFGEAPPAGAPAPPPSVPGLLPPTDGSTIEAGGAAIPAVRRKLVRTGEVSLRVKAWEPFWGRIEAEVARLDGFVGDAETRRSDEKVEWSRVTVRVPAEHFDTFVGWVQREGVATAVKLAAQDVTEEWYDLEARLANARRLEARVLELLESRTAKLSDVLEVERELARVRESIEQMEGRRRVLDRMVSLSTLTLEVQVEGAWTPPVNPTLAERARGAFLGSSRAVGLAGRGLVVAAAALLPWAAVFGATGWLGWKGLRRWTRAVGRRSDG